MKRYFFGSAAAVLCAGSLVAAQAPASQSQQPPSQPQSGAQAEPQSQSPSQERPSTQASAGATTTVTGCVYREEEVPGRSPNVAERAGVLEDYILADVRMSPAGSTGATGTSGAAGAGAGGGAVGAGGAAGAGAAATTGTSASAAGSGSMYKLEFVDDDRLQALVGKRVEVTGRVDRESGDAGARPQGTTGAGGADRPGTTSTGAPGAVSGNPGSAGNRPDDSGAAGQAGATTPRPGAAGQAGAGQPAQADRSIGPDSIELPEFEVTSIREMAGTCPATPAAR